jgi:hypothetical protein
MFLFPAAFEIAEFFDGTTEETTTLRTFRLPRSRDTTTLERLAVSIRVGADTLRADANASFAYELLMSTNK